MKAITSREARRMTVKEVAEALGVSIETVRANGKALFPHLFVTGKTTCLNEAQVTAIKLRMQGHHNLQNTLEVKNATTDLEKEMIIPQALVYQQEKIVRLQGENARKDKIIADQAQSLSRVSGMADWLIKGHQALGDKAFAQYGGLPYWFDH